MTPKQLANTIALARIGLQGATNDKGISEEGVAELAADLVAVKTWAKTYAPAQTGEAPREPSP